MGTFRRHLGLMQRVQMHHGVLVKANSIGIFCVRQSLEEVAFLQRLLWKPGKRIQRCEHRVLRV